MKLYVDSNYGQPFIRLLMDLHKMQPDSPHEVVSDWDENNTQGNTVVFLWDTGKKGIFTVIRKHHEEGFKVFVYKKPYGKAFSPFRVSLNVLSQWKKILKLIEEQEGAFLYTISDSSGVLKRVE